MNIVYYSGYASWWGAYPKDVLDVDHGRTVGGGEAGMLETAFSLAELGHNVTLYACAEPGVYKDVLFKPERDYYKDLYNGLAPDAVVAWSDPKPLGAAPDGCARLLCQQLNDLLFWPGWDQHVDTLVSPSQNHAEYMSRLGWTGRQAVVHNGCHPIRWFGAPEPRNRPLRVGYWSSPDRGLHHVLRAWPRIRRAVPGASLVVNYEIKKLFQFVDNQSVSGEAWLRLKFVRDLVLAAQSDPSVTFTGAMARSRLCELQKQTRVMLSPSDGLGFTEGFMVSTLDSLTAGALPILRPVDALPSLWDGVVWWLPKDTGSVEFQEAMVDMAVRGLTEWSAKPASPSREEMATRTARFTWAAAGQEMLDAVTVAVAAWRRAA